MSAPGRPGGLGRPLRLDPDDGPVIAEPRLRVPASDVGSHVLARTPAVSMPPGIRKISSIRTTTILLGRIPGRRREGFRAMGFSFEPSDNNGGDGGCQGTAGSIDGGETCRENMSPREIGELVLCPRFKYNRAR